MPLKHPVRSWSRRAFVALAGGCSALAQHPHAEVFPSEAKRYIDSATEFPVFRLTDPAHASLLPAPCNRALSSRQFLLFSNDRFGKYDIFRMEIRTGQLRRMTDAAALDTASVGLLPGDREFCYIDGPAVRSLEMSSKLRERELYTVASGYDRIGSLAVGTTSLYLVESRPDSSRIRAIPLSRGPVTELVEGRTISSVLPRPDGALVYRSGESIRFLDSQRREFALQMAPGTTGPMYWSPDGSSLLYLNLPANTGELNSLREHVIESGEDRLVSKTTQFVQFAPNRDASVFVGASGSKASPHILILLRSTQRELTLCEHRARDPRSLAVVFAPNSQRVLFQSDQQGKPAIYSISVERFVEATDS